MPFQFVLRCFTLAAIAYAGYALLVFLMQRQIIYPGRYIRVSGQAPAGIEPITLVSCSGRSEGAWFMPPHKRRAGERRPLVIFFHGNGEVIDYLPEQVEGFRNLGMGVLLVEYPGFGRSSGKPSEGSIVETAVTAYDVMQKREEVDSERIVIFGRSLGGGSGLCAGRPASQRGSDPAVHFYLDPAVCTQLSRSRFPDQGCV